MEIKYDDNSVIIQLNPNIYSIDVIQFASYNMLDKAFIVLDGQLKKEIIVELRPKEKSKDIEELGREFNNKLINYATYKMQAERNKAVRDSIVQRAFSNQNIQETGFEDEGFSKIEENLKELEQSSLEDPLGISEPWGDTSQKVKSNQKKQEETSSDNLISIDKIKAK